MFHVDFLQCDSGDAVRIPERTRGRGRPPLRTLMGAHHPRDGKQSGHLETNFWVRRKVPHHDRLPSVTSSAAARMNRAALGFRISEEGKE